MRLGDRTVALSIGAIAVGAYLAVGFGLATDYDYYGRLANALLHGRWWLEEAPSWLNELLRCARGGDALPVGLLRGRDPWRNAGRRRVAPRRGRARAIAGRGSVPGARAGRRAAAGRHVSNSAARCRAGRLAARASLCRLRPASVGDATGRGIRASCRGRLLLQPRTLLDPLSPAPPLRDLPRPTRARRGDTVLPAAAVRMDEPVLDDTGVPLGLRGPATRAS